MKHETSPEVVPHGSPQDDTFAGRGNRRSPARCQAIRSQQAERENQDLWCGSVLNANSTLTTLGYNAANEWMTATSGGKTANYSYDANGNELGNDGFGDPSKALAITYNAKNQTASVTDTQQNVIPMTYTGPGQAERVSAAWVASNPDTPGGPATYTYGSGLLHATDNTGTAYYTRDPGGALAR